MRFGAKGIPLVYIQFVGFYQDFVVIMNSAVFLQSHVFTLTGNILKVNVNILLIKKTKT